MKFNGTFKRENNNKCDLIKTYCDFCVPEYVVLENQEKEQKIQTLLQDVEDMHAAKYINKVIGDR